MGFRSDGSVNVTQDTMQRHLKLFLLLLSVILIVCLFALNRRLNVNYGQRIRHMQSMKFLVEDYYHDHQKMPSCLDDLMPLANSVMSPFGGNLELLAESDSKVILQERESRWTGLLQKHKIVVPVEQ